MPWSQLHHLPFAGAVEADRSGTASAALNRAAATLGAELGTEACELIHTRVAGRQLRELCAVNNEYARRRHDERLRFLAEASTLLSSSLDYETTLKAVARLAVDQQSLDLAQESLGADGLE